MGRFKFAKDMIDFMLKTQNQVGLQTKSAFISQADLTDSELYQLCKKSGLEALEARRKFIGLLPEVFRRRLYERRNFQSIYHFAAELGGVSQRLVDEVLRLEKSFAEMPQLHEALVKGEIGLSKLARIVSVVEIGNEAAICEKIRPLSRRAVDVLVKEMRKGDNIMVELGSLKAVERDGGGGVNAEQNGLFEAKEVAKSLSGQNFDYEILAKLSPELKVKLKELIDKEIDINAVLLGALAERDGEIAREKAEIGKVQNETFAKSRYISVRIKKLLKAEFGNRCSVQGCRKPAEQIHHERLYAIYREHDPRYLKPLCRGHHELAHFG